MEGFVGWPVCRARDYREAGYWRGETFGDTLRAWARRAPDRTALVDDRHRLTYRDLDVAADRAAAGLAALGLTRGDRILVQLPNTVDFPVLWFGCQRLGVVPVHAMPGHRASELTHLARLSGAVALVVPDVHARFDHRPLADEVRAAAPDLRHVLVAGEPGPGRLSLADSARDPDPDPPPGPAASDVALLLLSGGTTGRPKLIPRTHDDYAYNARASAELCGMDAESVYLAVLPVAFNFTMACPGVLGVLAVGGTAVLSRATDPASAFPLIERERVTVTALNPPLTPIWLEEAAHTACDLSSLRVLQVGSARLADDVAARVQPALPGVVLQQVFGMAEGLINYTRLDDPDVLRTTTQGAPLSPADEVRVVDAADRPVPDGEPGELLTRGPYTLCGYYRAAEHNATAFTADGFYRTGDVVRRLPTGHLIVVGRSKDQINRGGEKIAATEVEGHLLAHPDVVGAAVVAAPDDRFGERSVAFLRGRGAAPTRAELVRFLTGRGVAAYKHPDQVVAVDEFPLTAVGKIDKNVLRERVG